MAENTSSSKLTTGIIIAILVTAFYAYIYNFQPFPSPWNDVIGNWLFFLAPCVGAIYTTLLWRNFGKDEPPRRIWSYFALALWSWAIAEGIWAVYALFTDEVPVITIADLFWVLGTVLFAVSFYVQFVLLYPARVQRVQRIFLLVTIGILFISLATTTLMQRNPAAETSWGETFLAVFYPIADLGLAGAALLLWRLFGRGMWGRAWIGMVVITLSDAFYTGLTYTGQYQSSLESGNFLSMAADVLYLVAYLLLALACFSQWLLIHHGPPVEVEQTEANIEATTSQV